MSVLSRQHRGQLSSLVAIAAVVGLLVAYFSGAIGGNSGHTIVARFDDAQAITKGNTVHVDGVTAGTVTDISLHHNQAYLTLKLDPGFWPVHTDATASIRPVSLLGENYVDLNPGSASAPAMHDGGTITTKHTSNFVNLQSVLNSVNDPTATALGVFLTSLGQGMAGEGANGAAALKALAPALDNTTALTDLLDRQNQTLKSLLDQVTPVTGALATDNGKTLDHLVGTVNQTLGATSTQSKALGQDLQELPGFLDSTTNAFDQLGNLADQTTPSLQALTPLTDNLSAFSNELANFSAASDPAIQSLQPVLPQAQNLFAQLGPVVDTLRTSAPAQVADSQALIPLVQQGLTHGCSASDCPGLDALFGFVRNWSLATENYDGLSHYFRFFVDNHQTATGASAPAPAPLNKPAVTPSPSLPQLPPAVNSLTNTIGNTLKGLLGSQSSPSQPAGSNSATGLSQGQEQNLFSYLLGGN